MARLLNDWITTYLQYTEDTEPPVSYHAWTGLSIIASALQRRAWVQWGFDSIYPNMYVILVGPSGKTKKGTAIKIGKSILEDALGQSSNYLVGESITRESLIKRMHDNASIFIGDDGAIHHQSPLTVISEELSVFIGMGEMKFLATLINWYDSGDAWKYETKHAGTYPIKGVCLNLLGATAPDWISSAIPSAARNGGFASRVMFVVESEKSKTVAHPIVTAKMKLLRQKLAHDLCEIMNIKGEYSISKDAVAWYEDWYQRQDTIIRSGKSPVPTGNADMAGYCERRATHIKKIAISMAASRTDRRVIELQDFHRALELMEKTERNMAKAYDVGADNHIGEAAEVIVGMAVKSDKLKRSDVVRDLVRRRLGIGIIIDAEDALVRMGLIDRVAITINNDALLRVHTGD